MGVVDGADITPSSNRQPRTWTITGVEEEEDREDGGAWERSSRQRTLRRASSGEGGAEKTALLSLFCVCFVWEGLVCRGVDFFTEIKKKGRNQRQ